MKILLIGATGYLGSVVARHLAEAGHTVVALARPRGAVPMAESIAEVRYGDLADAASLADTVSLDVDAVVNLATPTGDEATDRAATEALLAPLRGTGRAFVYVSGTWVLGRTVTAATEQSRPDPIAIVGYRTAIEQQVLAAAHDGVRGVVVRPGVVHGHGGGILALLVDLARREGLGVTVGDGSAAWPMVHLDDLARLFLLALGAPPGTLVHAVTEPSVPVTALAAAAAGSAGVTKAVRHWPTTEAGAVLGPDFAEALALEQTVSGQLARELLGWEPRELGAVNDLAYGSYSPAQTLAEATSGSVGP